MIGPGGYELKLSPGSEVYDTEDSQTGHMMLPCSQFQDASRRQRKDEAQVFMVGDYVSPMESRAALKGLPETKAEKSDSRAFQSFDQKLSETLDLLDEAESLL